MALYCTIADLVLELDEKAVARLARDDSSTTESTSDAGVQARLTRMITEESNSIRSRLVGRVDAVDSVVAGSQLEADLRRWATVMVLKRLYDRRGKFGPQQNPFYDRAKLVGEEIAAVREARAQIGADNKPQNEAWSSSQDASPVYNDAAEGGAGTDSTLLDGF